MTRDEIRSRIPVLQAWLEQKAIQYREIRITMPPEKWRDFKADKDDVSPNIFEASYEWRVKPEPPKPREWWIVLNELDHIIGAYEKPSMVEIPSCQYIHVREVLSSDPETSLDAAERAYARRSQPKDPAAPPDQQP